MPGGIRNGFKNFINKVIPDGFTIPGISESTEEPEEDVFDKDLHLYNREGYFYVLVIDNNYLDMEHEKVLGENAGCSVASARTGPEGLELASKDKYDLILIAAELPRMDGIQTFNNLRNSERSKCKDSKVYVILSETDKEKDSHYTELGFHGVIRKPVEKCVFESIVLEYAPKKMIPDDERTIEYIKNLAETTKRLKRCDVRLSTGLLKHDGNMEEYKASVAKFCSSYDDSKNRALDALLLDDKMKYMDEVRELREQARLLGAIHLADIFDDHVNMAKDDTLEVANKNWKNLVSEWKYVVAGMADWLGKPEYVQSAFEQDKIKSNGIWMSENEMHERVSDIIYALIDDDFEYAESLMKLLLEYDFDDVIRRKLDRGSRLMDTDTELAIEIFNTI